MLKGALRVLHTTDGEIASGENIYQDRKFVGQKLDKHSIKDVTFRNCVFADCGMKEITFADCTFDNCVFSGCYLRGAKFANSTIRGSHFEIFSMVGLKVEDTELEFVEFFRCVMPYQEFVKGLRRKHDMNDRMLLNCAAEAHRVGRWRDAERYVARHLQEKRRHWKNLLFSKDGYYRGKPFSMKIRAALRLVASYVIKAILGDNGSILRFLGLGLGLVLVFLPLCVFWLDQSTIFETLDVPDKVGFLLKNYSAYCYSAVNYLLGTTWDIGPHNPLLKSKEQVEVVSKIVGILYLAVFANLITKSIGVGPKW